MNCEDDDLAAWQAISCPRVAASALRFNGRLIDERSAGLPGLRFAVYGRQSGGLTAVLPALPKGSWREDAFRATGWDDLLDQIEARCTELNQNTDSKTLADMGLLDRMRFAVERDQMLDAAGAVLDHWEQLAAAKVG